MSRFHGSGGKGAQAGARERRRREAEERAENTDPRSRAAYRRLVDALDQGQGQLLVDDQHRRPR